MSNLPLVSLRMSSTPKHKSQADRKSYYKYETRGLAGPDVDYRVFPKGLNMLAGNSSNREWRGPWPVPATSFWGPDDTTQEALAAKAMGFNCMNYEPGKNEPSFAYPWLRSKEYLDQNCINGIRAEIIFPSCWDGQNLDSDDHKSHMAYPPFIQDGICPDTHPVYLPILFYETIWQTNAFANVPGRFVFSNGDPTGYGYHADFIASWDDGVQEAVKANTLCTSLASDGEVESCPVFDGKVQSQADAQACKLVLPEAIANEQVDGSLERLPGNVNITGIRHDPGSPPSAGSEPYAPSTSLGASQSSVIASNQAASTGYYRPPVTSGAYPNSVSPSDQAAASITASPISDAPALATGSSITTTYTSGHYVVEMVLIEMTETVTATTAPTLTQTVVINGTRPTDGPAIKARHHRHARNHVHKHHHNGHF